MNNEQQRLEIKRLRDQMTGMKLLAKEIADNVYTIRFMLVSKDFQNKDVDGAVKRICSLLDFIDTAK